MITDLARSVLDLVYPPVCRLCDRLLAKQADFCPDCRGELLTDPFRSCLRCGSTIGPHVSEWDGCFRCRGERFAFEKVLRVGPHEGLRRDLVIRAKTDEAIAEAAAVIFAERMGCMLAKEHIDGVIGVPLHWYRNWHRKYNQSVVLARSLASAIGVGCWTRSLRRIRPTPSQTGLTGAARRENVRGAFRARVRSVAGKRLVLVDDVLTTGATADAAAKALLEGGAAQVIVTVMSHG